MPINDPGNAGTASDDSWPQPRLTDHDHEREFRRMARRNDPDARRRASSVTFGPITAAALLGAFMVGLITRSYLWVGGVGVLWLALIILASSIITGIYGPPPVRPPKAAGKGKSSS